MVNQVWLLGLGWAASVGCRVVAFPQGAHGGEGQGTVVAPVWESSNQHLPTYDICQCRSLGTGPKPVSASLRQQGGRGAAGPAHTAVLRPA